MAFRNNRPRTMNIEESHLESMNDSLAENLSTKIGQLKHLAIDLDTEARDHEPLLSAIGDDINAGSIRTANTTGRLRNIGRSRNMPAKRLTILVSMLVLCSLLFIYYLIIPWLLK